MAIDSTLSAGLFVLFALWLVVTAACQPTTKFSARIRNWDILNLIPAWTFFAPNPGMDDLVLLYRDRLVDGEITRWREVPPARPLPVLGPVWHPGRRHNKALLDAIKHLSMEANVRRACPRLVQISLPYLAILNFVSNLPRDFAASSTQFLLMKGSDSDGEEPSVMFLSEMHSLSG